MRTDPILQFIFERRREMLETLRRLVECESPSSQKAAVDRCLDLVADCAEPLGCRLRRHRSREFGDHLQADFDFAEQAARTPPGGAGPYILVPRLE